MMKDLEKYRLRRDVESKEELREMEELESKYGLIKVKVDLEDNVIKRKYIGIVSKRRVRREVSEEFGSRKIERLNVWYYKNG